eukprot:8438402-Alexandrium_andersonii.AAC.1
MPLAAADEAPGRLPAGHPPRLPAGKGQPQLGRDVADQPVGGPLVRARGWPGAPLEGGGRLARLP